MFARLFFDRYYEQSNLMASNSQRHSNPSGTQLMKTVNVGINVGILQDVEFQEFTKKLEHSQHVKINLDEINEIMSITGKRTSIKTSYAHIQQKIDKKYSNLTETRAKPPKRYQPNPGNNHTNQMLSKTIELSAARYSFLELFGEKILNSIHNTPDISSVSLMNGKLQLTGDAHTIQMIKSHLEEALGERTVYITYSMKQHLTLTCGGRLLKKFSEKYYVGTSLQQSYHHGNNTCNDTRTSHDIGRGYNANRDRHSCTSNSTTHDTNLNHYQQCGTFRNDYLDQQPATFGVINPGQQSGTFGVINHGQQSGAFQSGYYGQQPSNFGVINHSNQQPTTFGVINCDQQSGAFQGDYYDQQPGAFRGNDCDRGQYVRRNLPTHHIPSYSSVGLGNLNSDDSDSEESEKNPECYIQNSWYENKVKEYEEDDDDNNSQTSDSDVSLSSNFTINSTTNSKNFNAEAKNSILITLCSDSRNSLNEAVAELQSYSLHTESWALTADEFIFISKQKQRGKFQTTNMSTEERCLQIKHYLRQTTWNHFIHIYVSFSRGMWYVKVKGLTADVRSAVVKIKGSLNNAAETEVHIPISQAMRFFLKTKASSDIDKLRKIHSIKITTFSPPGHNVNGNGQDNSNHCLKLVGCVSHINAAQIAVQNFLGNLSEQEQNFPCNTWDLSKVISKNIVMRLKKIQKSDDYEAVGLVNLHNSATEIQQTTPEITFTIVSINEDTTNEIIQQCKDIIEGYVIWEPSSNEYRVLANTFFIEKRITIEHFRQEWDTHVQFDSKTNIVIIPARSKMIADDIKETLQSLALGQANRLNRISVTIPIELNIRRFVNHAIQPIFDEAKTQKVYIDSKNRSELTLHGRSEVVSSIQEKINNIIKDIERKLVRNRLKLTFAESELFRANSYEIIRGIERETNTIIRDVKFTKKENLSNINKNDDTNLTLTCVVNDRGQTILVKKGDITKIIDVDAIINAANGSLNHAGGVDKAIAAAAGPALDKECQELIANNGGIAIPTGKAVKTTAGHLRYKGIIHAIGPQYAGGYQQERPLLFSSILSSLKLAEQEGYESIALPAISAATYGFPLEDCTNIIIRAIKQFFADFPESDLRKVILLDMDDSVCNSFTSAVVKNHTNTIENNNDDLIKYDLPPLTAKWCWEDDVGEKIYNDNDTRQLEAAFQQYLHTFIPSTLKINVDNIRDGIIVCYSIHFRERLRGVLKANSDALNNPIICGHQTRESTNFQRNIIRYPLAKIVENKSVVYHPKPLDVYLSQTQITEDDWEIISITKKAIEQTELTIRKAIETATIKEHFSINLNQDIDTHETAIRNIATQQLIQVDFEEDHKEKLTLILKGLKQNVLQVKLLIALYVQDVLRMQMDKDDELSIPKEWGEQEEECKLVELSKNHPDFIRIENRMKETMKNVKIEKIERIQNLSLWNHYAFSRRLLRQKLSEKPDLEIEMELFHGTRTTSPSEIYNGDCGFDMRFCTSGLWGLGSYFAQNASYSCQNYSSKLDDTKRQVFLAHVLTGESYDYKEQNDLALRLPPKKNASIANTRYNSVSGQTGGSRVYIIYENRVTYPAFLITFSQ